MLIDSALTKQWLDEWLEIKQINNINKYAIKVQIRTYVQDKLSITLSYNDEVVQIPVQHEPILLERSVAGIERTVTNWLENNKEQILYYQRWFNFVKGLNGIDEFKEKNSPA